jgi:hypothetical protein
LSALVTLSLPTSTVGTVHGERDEPVTAATIEEGKQLACKRTTGHGLARHRMGRGDRWGNIGPLVIDPEAPYPDKRCGGTGSVTPVR